MPLNAQQRRNRIKPTEPIPPCVTCGTLVGEQARHRQKPRPARIRGMCQRCYYNWQNAQRRKERDINRVTGVCSDRLTNIQALPPEYTEEFARQPCPYLPGTPEKIEHLVARFEHNVHRFGEDSIPLWNPKDAGGFSSGYMNILAFLATDREDVA
jgi:hypothetical protein